MKVKDFTVTLACVNLLFIKGMDFKNAVENGSMTDFSRRILNGKPANAFDFPFIVKLSIGDQFCGGAIIADRWILTAAHCTYNKDCSMIEIWPAVWEGERSVLAFQCYLHIEYTDDKNAYDIAVIQSTENLIEDGRAKTIPLPPSGMQFPPGTPAVIVGWGQTENQQYPGRLLWAEFRVTDWDFCDRAMREHPGNCNGYPCPYDLPLEILCLTGEGSSPAGSCYGDSGGPVIINGLLAGVVSFGVTDVEDQCIIGSPSMQTNVVDYLTWIYSVLSSRDEYS